MSSTTPQAPPARLLIVDDEKAHMLALANTLEDAGFSATGFTSARQAMELLHSQRFDLVLTDLIMPEMDGIEFLRAAQATDQDLVGIVMTGHAAVDTAIAAMKAGAIDYVLKPFKLSVILPILTRALDIRRLRLEVEKLQQRLREHIVELEAANRDLESFSYSVSHDLRAPLRAISGFSSILVSNFAPQLPEDAQVLLQRIMTNASRMGELIEHLLRFSQLGRQPIIKASVNVRSVVDGVLEELSVEHGDRKVDLRLGELPSVFGDPVLMRQVFSNLLSNAFKFTRRQAQAVIEIGCTSSSSEHIYFVRDNGAGFDMRYADRLFGVFQRLHNSSEFEGTGVGLSLVHRIVSRHGGRIWAESAPGLGATFFVGLPAVNTPRDE